MVPVLVVALGLVLPCGDAGGACVLKAGAGARLQAALAAVPSVHVQSVQAGATAAVARLCGAEAGCFVLELRRSGPDCPSREEREACVILPAEVPPALAGALRQAVGAIPGADLWMLPRNEPAPVPPTQARTTPVPVPATVPTSTVPLPPPASPDRNAWVLWGGAAAQVLVPLVLGWLAGAGLRRRRGVPSGRRVRWALATLPVLLVLLVYPSGVASVGLWDLVLVGALAGAGLALGLRRPGREGLRRAVPGTIVVLVCFLALEVASRLVLQPPPETPPPVLEDLWSANVRMTQTAFAQRWKVLDPADPASADLPGVEGRPMVLHSGNSVVQGTGVMPGRGFTDLLNARNPPVWHRNIAMAGTGLDLGFVVVRNWLQTGRVSGLVMFLHPNYPFVMDLQFQGCGGQPLVEYTPDGPVQRCRDLGAGVRVAPTRWDSPIPFPFAVARGVSHFLGHAAFLLARASSPDRDFDQPVEVYLAHSRDLLAALTRDMKAAGVPWMAVILPGRPELEGDTVERERHRALESLAREILEPAGVPVVDGFEVLQQAVGREGAESLFVDRCCHLSDRGHEVVAEWLQTTLAPLLEAIEARRAGFAILAGRTRTP